MEMKHKNSWSNLPTVKKGNIGEQIVKNYLEQKGYIIYEPVTPKAHLFDYWAMNRDSDGNKNITAVEVKTKPRRIYYPDTGIDIRHYKEYQSITSKHNMRLLLFFVDEYEKKVYGNTLERISKEQTISIKRKGKNINLSYPLYEKDIIYFPINQMVIIAKLTNEEAESIKEHSTSKYNY